MNRRTLLAGLASSALLATPAIAQGRMRISLYNPHTEEHCSFAYNGRSLTSGQWRTFLHITRDWREEKIGAMDPELLRWITGLTNELGDDHPFLVLSGYRTAKTNHDLTGTASNSLHMQGRALDLRRLDYSTSDLRDAAYHLHIGGVGYYPQQRNQFVHVDTGQWRTW